MDLLTAPTVAVMMQLSTAFWGGEPTYIGVYRDLEVCRARIEELDKAYSKLTGLNSTWYATHRYCRLEAVVQK
jgi:acyl carrier protein phosphodiesterase